VDKLNVNLGTVLQVTIIILLVIVIWQNESNETQLKEYGQRIESIEIFLYKYTPYQQIE